MTRVVGSMANSLIPASVILIYREVTLSFFISSSHKAVEREQRKKLVLPTVCHATHLLCLHRQRRREAPTLPSFRQPNVYGNNKRKSISITMYSKRFNQSQVLFSFIQYSRYRSPRWIPRPSLLCFWQRDANVLLDVYFPCLSVHSH